ncbi:MAG: hypothetical protein ABIQ15_13075 [Nocardioides sp.]
MTTTTSKQGQSPRVTGMRPLVGASVGAVAVGGLVVAVGALSSGSDAASAAAVGGLIAAGVFVLGSTVVNVVASLLPAASLVVALLTYLLQVVVMAVAFAGLSGSALLATAGAPTWLAAAVIAVTATWLVAQIWLTTRMRIPVYDLPPPSTPVAAPQSGPGGER